jgi:hypothetical protein
MQFMTPVKTEPAQLPIPVGTSVLALGSCFAERIGSKLAEALFPVSINPTGIAYNPLSLATNLSQHNLTPQLFFHAAKWRSLSHHGSLTGYTPQETLERLRVAEKERIQQLNCSKLLILTLGTAQVYRLVTTGSPVNNCHRLPQQLFARSRLQPEEVVAALSPFLQSWLEADQHRRVVSDSKPGSPPERRSGGEHQG